ncbi:hypothetical protein F4861DRAFT_28409 [Xylaria intraflava]|nr:hypothetical protein F4861DRAFT_28409 [Xylaria intraflava]
MPSPSPSPSPTPRHIRISQYSHLDTDPGPPRDPRGPRAPRAHARSAPATIPAPTSPLRPGRRHRSGRADTRAASSRTWRSGGGGGPRAFYTGPAQNGPRSVSGSFLSFPSCESLRFLRLCSRGVLDAPRIGAWGVIGEFAVGMAVGAQATAALFDSGGTGVWDMCAAEPVLPLDVSEEGFRRMEYDGAGFSLCIPLQLPKKGRLVFMIYSLQVAEIRPQGGTP